MTTGVIIIIIIIILYLECNVDHDSSSFTHDVMRLIEQTSGYRLESESLDGESMRIDVSTLM